MSNSKADWFFKNSAILFVVPFLALLICFLGALLLVHNDAVIFKIGFIWWAYFNLFLTLDVGLSLLCGRTGNTFKYFKALMQDLPEIAERGKEYPAGNFFPQIVAKAGLIFVLGILPFYYWYTT